MLTDATLRIYPNDRIGVLGANGAGKTTLLRCLAGELEPLQGTLTRGRHSALGYFAQHQLESLDLDRTPLDHIDECTDYTSQEALDYLGGWGFGGADVRRPARTFSGGEKARLVLATIACQEPAVLVLDEPTNHLDLDCERRWRWRCSNIKVPCSWFPRSPPAAPLRRFLLARRRRHRAAFPRRSGSLHGVAANAAWARGARASARKITAANTRRCVPCYANSANWKARSTGTICAWPRSSGSWARRPRKASRIELAGLARARKKAAQAVQRSEQAWLAVQEELDRIARNERYDGGTAQPRRPAVVSRQFGLGAGRHVVAGGFLIQWLLVFYLRTDAMQLGFSRALMELPPIILLLLGGIYADRTDGRRMLLWISGTAALCRWWWPPRSAT